MNITDYYNPSQGLMVVSPSGGQKFTEGLDSYSQIFAQISVSKNNTKHCIDNAWESQNIYYCNYDTGYVKKISYDGTELASLKLTNPSSISVIQYSTKMQISITYPPQQEIGCWIYDEGTGKVIKTDSQLNILYEVYGFVGPAVIIADVDSGCLVADDSSGYLVKYSSDADLLGAMDYSSFSPSISSVSEMRSYSSDLGDRVWILSSDKIYGIGYSNGVISQWLPVIDPLDGFSSSSIEWEQDHIGALDVDRNNNNLYVSGGDGSSGWILQYNSAGLLENESTYLDIVFPYVLKVVQGYGSNSIYVLSDPEKWEEFGYGSSSSSDSSYSSSSSESSSSESSSSDSSSSSESSFGYSFSSSSSSSSLGCVQTYSAVGSPSLGGYYHDRYVAYNTYPTYKQSAIYYIYQISIYLGFSRWVISTAIDDNPANVVGYRVSTSDGCPDGNWYDELNSLPFALYVDNRSSSSSSSSMSSQSLISDSSESESSSSSSSSSSNSFSYDDISSSSTQIACNACVPALSPSYNVTFGGTLAGDFALWDGNTYQVDFSNSCDWVYGDLTGSILLTWNGVSWAVVLNGIPANCTVAIDGPSTSCDPTSSVYVYDGISSDCAGCTDANTCANSVSVTATVAVT